MGGLGAFQTVHLVTTSSLRFNGARQAVVQLERVLGLLYLNNPRRLEHLMEWVRTLADRDVLCLSPTYLLILCSTQDDVIVA